MTENRHGFMDRLNNNIYLKGWAVLEHSKQNENLIYKMKWNSV